MAGFFFISENITKLAQFNILSFLDLLNGYHQVGSIYYY